MTLRTLGEGSWIADDYQPGERMISHCAFFVWCAVNDGQVLRYVDRSYQARIR